MSTLVELAGFTAWVVAAFAWQSVALSTVTGLLALGAVLLLIGVSIDDGNASIAIGRVLNTARAMFARLFARKTEEVK